MTFLPIVERELREASRRRETFRIRHIMAAAALFGGGWIMLAMIDSAPQRLGETLMGTLAAGVYLYCALVGVFTTADCLSEEKREGTIGLLFLTDLKGYDIVFGKLAASSLNAFYGVLAVFPVMAIPLLVGGVTVAEFWRIVLVSLNILFFSLSAGMFCSALSRDERRAMVGTILVLLFFTIGLPVIGAIGSSFGLVDGSYIWWFLVPTLYAQAHGAFDGMLKSVGMDKFVASVVTTHVIAWVMLGLAARKLPHTWQDKAMTAKQQRRQEKLQRWELGAAEVRRAGRTRWLDWNPFYWMLTRHRAKPLAGWTLVGLTAIIWAVGLAKYPRDWQNDVSYILTAVCLHTILKWWLATEAARNFSHQRQIGALELLLSTPITVKELVRGQIRALEWQFAGPVAVVVMADVVFLLAGQRSGEILLMWIVGILIFLLDLVTLAYVGMWRGLNNRRANRAAASTVVQVLVVPWMIFFGLATLMGLGGGFRGNDAGYVMIVAWFVISLVTDWVLLAPAKESLHEHFRRVATERFSGGKS